MKQKILNFTLHTHMPYVLHSEAEYWLYEASLNSYLPLIEMIDSYSTTTPLFTMNLSPILLVQLSSSHFKENFKKYINTRRQILSIQLQDTNKQTVLQKDLIALTKLENIFSNFQEDIIKAFQTLQKQNKINIITSAATHAFFPPFMQFPNIIQTQISLGKAISEYFFPNISGFWVPECAISPNIGKFLSDNNIAYTFADPSSIQKNQDLIPSYQDPYGIHYICRNYECTAKIWDAKTGYPSNPSYREFHSDINSENSTTQEILRQANLPLSGVSIYSTNKQVYSHSLAQEQTFQDANNYIDFLQQQFLNNKCLTVCFDTELFGHWWKDGVSFLNQLIPLLEQQEIILNPLPLETQTISTPHLSTWGKNYTSESWINQKTQDIWEYLIPYAYNIEQQLASSIISPDVLYNFLLQQASDWPFLITYDSFTKLSKEMIFENSHSCTFDNIMYKLIQNKIDFHT